MLKLECKNGTLDVTSVKESRNFNSGLRVKMLDIVIDGQAATMDEVELVLTDPEPVADFLVRNEDTGVTCGTYEGYSLSNITRDVQNDRSSIFVSFAKGNS